MGQKSAAGVGDMCPPESGSEMKPFSHLSTCVFRF